MFRRTRILDWTRQLRDRRAAPRLARNVQHQTTPVSRIDRITAKLPQGLQKYTKGLRNAPVSHIVSFLILHELTAIVPLFALFALFHYTTLVPIEYMTSHFDEYVQSGIARFEKYFSRKEWFGFSSEDIGDKKAADVSEDAMNKWTSGEKKYEILVEVALAYAITKALLPIRIVGSIWATPWFANFLLGMRRAITGKP